MADDFCRSVLEKCSADDYYELLGCDELSTTEQINAEFRHKVRKFHPDKNAGDDKTAMLFEKLKRARETLADEEKRKSYDKWRNIGIAVPYETWMELSCATHTSIHWAAKPRKEPMLEYGKKGNCNSSLIKPSNPSTSKNTSENISSETDNVKVTYYVTNSMGPYARVGWKSRNGQISKFRRYEI